MKRTWTALVGAIALAATGCSGAAEDGSKTVTPDGEVLSLQPQHRSVADLAVEALAEHLNVPQAEIEVDSVRPVEWRDSSIGCPQPDQAYMQVITPGHRVTLRAGGAIHTVNEANGNAFICTRAKSVAGVTNQLELEWAAQAAAARRDLAGKLGIDESHVIVSAASGTTWSDASLGCPEPGVEYDATPIKGYVLRLRHGGRDFTYHTDLDRVIACPAFSDD